MSITTYLRFMFIARPTTAPAKDSSDRAWSSPGRYENIVRKWDRGRVYGTPGGGLDIVNGRLAVRASLEPLTLHPRYAVGGAQAADRGEDEAGSLDQCSVSIAHYAWTVHLAGLYLPEPGRFVGFMEHPTLHVYDVVGIVDVAVLHDGPLPFDITSLGHADRQPPATLADNRVAFVFQPKSLNITMAWAAHFVEGYAANPGLAKSTQAQVAWLPCKVRICVHEGGVTHTVRQIDDQTRPTPVYVGTQSRRILHLHAQVLPFRVSMRLATVRGHEHALWQADVACPGLIPCPKADIYAAKGALCVSDVVDAQSVTITHGRSSHTMFRGTVDLSALWSLRITPSAEGLNVALLHTLTGDRDPVVAFQEIITWTTMELE